MSDHEVEFEDTDIAIIGMAARLPGANNVDEFWHNLKNSIESYTEYTNEELLERGVPQSILDNPNYQKIGRPLDNMEMFDAALFGFSPKDASIMDPQHRHFLEVSWEALEHAGYDPQQYSGSIGVFGGSGHNAYMPYNLFTNPDLMKSIGLFLARHTSNDKDFLTTRVSYCLNLQGPSINVQTACSTSLVAVHLATQSLLSGECDMALAGGVTIEMPHRVGYMYEEGGIQSPDGHCRTFDENSNGTVFGSGAVQVVLKRIEDAINDGDTIHAIIKGSAINNDGSSKVGYLAPSVDGQAAAITEALILADVDAESISYVETHGTGTPVGDPIELTALNQAYRAQTQLSDYCGIGSVKTNIGHLDTAAGGVGLIKIVQSMKHKQLPASLHFTKPNVALDLSDSPFYVNASLKDWNVNGKRRAAINSLGVGGTNAHIILEEAPELPDTIAYDGYHLFCLSARTDSALDNVTENLDSFFQKNPEVNLSDAAYTLKVGRQGQAVRRIVVANSIEDLKFALSGEDNSRLISQKINENKQAIYFMYTGQGSQYIEMCKGLYENEAVFKAAVDECDVILTEYLNLSIIELLYPSEDNAEATALQLNETQYTQPALFTIEYAMTKLLQSWGVIPDALIGHSIGEYVAACVSGLFTLQDALKLVASRGRLMQSLEKGSMLVVPLNESDVKDFLTDDLSIAGINAPGLVVVSGPDEKIDALVDALQEKSIDTTRLHTSHAFHSSMMDPILSEFKSLFERIQFGEIKIPFVSNTTGKLAEPEQVSNADYWTNHLRGTVRFADGMTALMSTSDAVFIECGPGSTLSTFARQNINKKNSHSIIQTIRHPKKSDIDSRVALSALGRIWLAGVDIDWNLAHGDLKRRRIALPTYAFEHQHYWIEAGQGGLELNTEKELQKQDFSEWFYQPGWDTSPAVSRSIDDPEEVRNVICFTSEDEESSRITSQLKLLGLTCYEIKQADSYKELSEFEYQINPQSEADYQSIFKAISKKTANRVTHIVHNWSIDNQARVSLEESESSMSTGFNSLFFMAKYFASNEPDHEVLITVNTNNCFQVSGESLDQPIKATMLGPIKVMTQEINNLSCKMIDIDFNVNQKWKVDELVSSVCTDLLQKTEDEEIAYRGTNRFVRSYKKLSIANNDNTILLKKGGNYLITGGIGGIGYELAQHLINSYDANLVILNRTSLPEKSQWNNIESFDSKVRDRISKLQSLEVQASKLLSINADVCDFDSLNAAIKSSTEELGKLDGIFHTAGIVDDNLIAFKTLDDAKEVLAPKVKGVINLDKALLKYDLDFMFLFSSISTELGLSGQVDYTAANSFLNAYSQYKKDKDGLNVIAANWGVWANTGMASQLGEGGQKESIDNNYFYTSKINLKAEDVEYSAILSAKTHWIIDGHRSKNNTSLIPGTAYLEMARNAFSIENKLNKPIRLSDVFFVSPFVIEGDEEKQINVQLLKNVNSTEFLIQSEFGEENVRGTVGYVDTNAPDNLHIDNIIERCNKNKLDLKGTAEHNHLVFSDRWRCINTISFGKKEAVVELEIDDKFVGELDDYILHPAVMDMATGTAQSLNPDYDSVKDLYIPISYSKITVYKNLTQHMYSHIVYSADEGQGSQTSIFDVVITDDKGEVLVVVNQFIMKRVDPSVLQSLKSNRTPIIQSEKTASDHFFDMGLRAGMTNDEGLRAVDMLLSKNLPSQVIVSPLLFPEYLKLAKNLRNANEFDDEIDDDLFEGLERPNLSSEFVAPKSELEINIAKIWKSALGISDVGINDDFFDLGGHSLLLTQVVSRLKKHLSIDLPITSLFETPTIEQWAKVISENEHLQGEVIPLVVSLDRKDYAVKYSELMASM